MKFKNLNTMKNIVKIQSVLLLAFFITLPYFLFTQEEGVQEKKVRIKTVKEVDGEKVVTDTTFTVTEQDQVKQIVKKYTMSTVGDSSTQVMVDVVVDSDEDVEWHESNKNVFIMKHGDGDEEVIHVPHGSGSKVIKIKTDDGDDEKIIVIKSPGHSGHKVIKWVSEDGEEHEFDFDYDYDFDVEAFHDEMAKLEAEMKELQIEIIDEQGRLHDELIELKHIEELEKLKNMEVIVVPPAPHDPHFYHDYTWTHKGGMEVADEELREAGIKNKPDRLELDEIDVEKEDGVVDLSFSMKGEGNPKVDVYNIYGDKVFSGKPELMNNKYQIKMDLSKKQYGTYYMQIISGSSSKTLRLKL
jgi:hypothetical protein